MRQLPELIAYYRAREQECARERDQSVNMPTAEDQQRVWEVWERERQIARDTASWLETIGRRHA